MKIEMSRFSICMLYLTLIRMPRSLGLPLLEPFSKPSWTPHEPQEERGIDGAFESDIRLRKGHDGESLDPNRIKRNAISKRATLWPNGIVNYRFNGEYSTLPPDIQRNVSSAMRNWEKMTCIRFQERPNSINNIVLFSEVKGGGCSSEVGRPDSVSETTLAYSCSSVGSIMHEIGHIIGYYHEQSRPDRDDHVTVNFGNVQRDKRNDFQKYDEYTVRTRQPYDISSVMHYGPTWFSKDGHSLTIEPKTKNLLNWMGQRDGLSFIDAKTANELYKCKDKCTGSLRCENEGYVGQFCSCVCPPGLTGRLCDEVVRGTPGCGGVLSGNDGVITSPNYPSNYDSNVDCNWLIKGPREGNIQLIFSFFDVEGGTDGPCSFDFLEVRTLGSSLRGRTFCGSRIPEVVTHTGNRLFLRFQSDSDVEHAGFKLRFRIVSS